MAGRILLALLGVVCLVGWARAGGSEILWDSWGVPHIYAETEADLMYAWGWAQMHSHGDVILEHVGIVRGRAAEYWGEAYLESDRYVWTMGLPQLVARLAPAVAADTAFIDGMNAYAQGHPGELRADLRRVLPLRPEDPLALAFYDEFFNGMVVTPANMGKLREEFLTGATVRDPHPSTGLPGSNAWVVGPGRSTTGHAILLSNPHAPWPSLQGARHLLMYEAHLVMPDLDFYGVGFIGLPAFTFGFNPYLAWTGTSAPTFDFVDSYELVLRDGGYRFDGRVLPFDVETVTLRVRGDAGDFRDETLTVKRSLHGPVLAERGDRALAVAFPLPSAEEATKPQLWEMMRARDLAQFSASLAAQNMFAFNFLYADRQGNIMYALNGIFPDRPVGPFDWAGLLPGDTSATVWRGKLPVSAMPVVVNPVSGHLQSANETPHYAAWPDAVPLDNAPADWPAPDAWPRTRRSLALLESQPAFSPEDVMRLKYDTHSGLADQVLDTVLAVGRQYGSPDAQEAVDVLAAWDRSFDADSVGAVVFAFWAMAYDESVLGGTRFPADAFAVPFDPSDPIGTPSGLADPAKAVQALEFSAHAVNSTFGSLRVPWGAFVHFRVGDHTLPGFGAPPEAFGVFTPNFAAPAPDGGLATVAGDTWVAVIELAESPRAWAVLPYGNASQAGDPHVGDQLALYADESFRPVWTDRAVIEANLERREVLP
ncbi:MAG: penicillin acylase family protein [Deinococcales bacterium]